MMQMQWKTRSRYRGSIEERPEGAAEHRPEVSTVNCQLKTTRFPLKGIRIPGFTGSCIVEAN